MNSKTATSWLVILAFIIVLILFLWYLLGSSPTLDQLIIAFMVSYSALFIYLDGKITRTERELTNKIEDMERRIRGEITSLKK